MSKYEARDWVVGDKTYRVRVQTDPGKFEGEPIWTQHFYAASSWADESIYDSANETLVADCFRAPFNLETLYDESEGAGPGQRLTEDELDCLAQYAGAITGEDSLGFVWLELYGTTAEYERAIDEMRAEYEKENPDAV